jgi:hypothetical protein
MTDSEALWIASPLIAGFLALGVWMLAHGLMLMIGFRPLSRAGLRHVLSFPAAVVLALLVRRNYHLRHRHLAPDEWYWADVWLTRCGYVVAIR